MSFQFPVLSKISSYFNCEIDHFSLYKVADKIFNWNCQQWFPLISEDKSGFWYFWKGNGNEGCAPLPK